MLNMLKKLLLIFLFIIFSQSVFANEEEAKAFFEKYVAAANSYSASVPSYYAADAKILRAVKKSDGTIKTVQLPTARYIKQMRLMRNAARVRGYKNFYTQESITPEGSDYKISALRTPKGDKNSLPAYFVVGKDSSGAYKIKTEYMQTKEQGFLKYNK